MLSREQALAAGLTDEAWAWRLRRDWQRLTPGVALGHRGPVPRQALAWGAVLHAGPDAALTGAWALAAQGWTWPRLGAVDLLVPAQRRLAPVRLGSVAVAVRAHRSALLQQVRHPSRLPPSVQAAHAALHAAAWLPRARDGEDVLAGVVQQRLVPPSALRSALGHWPRLPRRALIRAVLDDVELGASARTELDLLGLLREHRLPRPDGMQLRERSHRLCYLDAWWRRQRVALEADGAHHRLVGHWEHDVLRANDLHLHHRGHSVLLLRATGGQLRRRDPDVVRQLRLALLA